MEPSVGPLSIALDQSVACREIVKQREVEAVLPLLACLKQTRNGVNTGHAPLSPSSS